MKGMMMMMIVMMVIKVHDNNHDRYSCNNNV